MAHVNVEDKRILLVGATGVLGRQYSHVLSQEGARLVLADRKESDVEALAEELGAQSVVMDISSEDRVVEGVKAAAGFYGGFDGVVNNAAANFIAPTKDLSPRGYEAISSTVMDMNRSMFSLDSSGP